MYVKINFSLNFVDYLGAQALHLGPGRSVGSRRWTTKKHD